jgi:hypothetical protein
MPLNQGGEGGFITMAQELSQELRIRRRIGTGA